MAKNNNPKVITETHFYACWNASTQEVFRLQLLNSYAVDFERVAFDNFMNGKSVNYLESPGFKEWIAKIREKRNEGVSVINLHVVDLPISDYFRFGIGFLRISEQSGQESRFLERKRAELLLKDFQDFYLFDSKTIMLVNYDDKGGFLSLSNPITDPKTISRSICLRDELMKISIPMETFISQNNIDLASKPNVKRNKIMI